MSDFSSYMWSVPDWRTDEMYSLLDNREQGIYRNLIDECWVSGSISSDPELLARFVHEPLDYFARVWAKIRGKFRPINNGARLISTRLEEDRRRLMLNAKFNEKRAKKAAETRWNKARAEKELHATSTFVASVEHGFEQCQTHTHTKKDPSLLDFSNTEESTIQENCIGDRQLKLASTGTDDPRAKDAGHRRQGRRAAAKSQACRSAAPDQFEITADMRAWAVRNDITCDLDEETEKMLDHHRARGNTHIDWLAAWRLWMRNTKKWGSRHGTQRESEAQAKQRRTDEASDSIVRRVIEKTGGGIQGGTDGRDTDRVPGKPRLLPDKGS